MKKTTGNRPNPTTSTTPTTTVPIELDSINSIEPDNLSAGESGSVNQGNNPQTSREDQGSGQGRTPPPAVSNGGAAETSLTAVLDYAYPIPPLSDANQLKEVIYEWVNSDNPQQGKQLREFIESTVVHTLNEQGLAGLEQLITLYKQIESIKKLREAQVAPFQDRVQSFKLLIDEDDQVRRMVQRQVIQWMVEHADEFRDSNGKLRATTQSFKFSVTEKGDHPLILNSAITEAIKQGNQRFEETLEQMSTDTNEEPNPIADATTTFFMALLTHLWNQLPVPPEFLKLNVTVGLDEKAIKQALEAGEELNFARLGEPTRWLTFSGRGKDQLK